MKKKKNVKTKKEIQNYFKENSDTAIYCDVRFTNGNKDLTIGCDTSLSNRLAQLLLGDKA